MDMSHHRAILDWIEQDLCCPLDGIYTVAHTCQEGRSLSCWDRPALWMWVTVTFFDANRDAVTQLFSFDAP